MQSHFRTSNQKILLLISSKKFRLITQFLLMTALLFICCYVFAGVSDDPFSGVDKGIRATTGTGGAIRNLIWAAEAIAASVILIASRSLIKAGLGIVGIETIFRGIALLAGF